MGQQNKNRDVVRDGHGRIISGTPNPGGRPKAVKEVAELARAETAASIAALVRVRDTSTEDRAVVAAANSLLDRGWGRAQQHVSVSVENKKPREMSVREIEQRLDELREGVH